MKDIYALLKGKKFLFIMKIIICGLWKELERDKINTCRLTSKRSALCQSSIAATELLAKELAKVISLSFTSTKQVT